MTTLNEGPGAGKDFTVEFSEIRCPVDVKRGVILLSKMQGGEVTRIAVHGYDAMFDTDIPSTIEAGNPLEDTKITSIVLDDPVEDFPIPEAMLALKEYARENFENEDENGNHKDIEDYTDEDWEEVGKPFVIIDGGTAKSMLGGGYTTTNYEAGETVTVEGSTNGVYLEAFDKVKGVHYHTEIDDASGDIKVGLTLGENFVYAYEDAFIHIHGDEEENDEEYKEESVEEPTNSYEETFSPYMESLQLKGYNLPVSIFEAKDDNTIRTLMNHIFPNMSRDEHKEKAKEFSKLTMSESRAVRISHAHDIAGKFVKGTIEGSVPKARNEGINDWRKLFDETVEDEVIKTSEAINEWESMIDTIMDEDKSFLTTHILSRVDGRTELVPVNEYKPEADKVKIVSERSYFPARLATMQNLMSKVSDEKKQPFDEADGDSTNSLSDNQEWEDIVKELVEDAIGKLDTDYELNGHEVEKVEHEERDGFIPHTNGGFIGTASTDLMHIENSGRYPKLGKEEVEKAIEECDKLSREQFIQDHKEELKGIPEDKVNYSDLYKLGKADLAEELSELEHAAQSDDNSTVEFKVGAYFYNPESEHSDNKGEYSMYVYCAVNADSPNHREKSDRKVEREFSFKGTNDLKEQLEMILKELVMEV